VVNWGCKSKKGAKEWGEEEGKPSAQKKGFWKNAYPSLAERTRLRSENGDKFPRKRIPECEKIRGSP